MRKLFMLLLIVACGAFIFANLRPIRPVYVIETNSRGPVFTMSPQEVCTVKTAVSAKKTKSGKSTNERVEEIEISGVGPSRDDAWTKALKNGVLAIERHYQLQAAIPPEELAKYIVGSAHEESFPLGESNGKDLGEAKKVSMTVQLDSDYLQTLGRREREYRTTERMIWTARGLAVIVAGLFAVAGYVRLDEWSKGYYSGVWKTLAIAAVVGVSFGAWYLR